MRNNSCDMEQDQEAKPSGMVNVYYGRVPARRLLETCKTFRDADAMRT